MNDTSDAAAIFAPLWRYKWLILIVAILVAGGTYLYYKRQPQRFLSTTQVYLGAGSEELIGEKGAGKNLSTNVGNQTALINSIVVESAHRQLRKAHNPTATAASRGKVLAKSAEKSEFIAISAEARTARAAALLANTTAQIYAHRQHSSHQRAVTSAIAIARRQLRRLEIPRTAAPTVTKGKTTTKAPPPVSNTNVIQAANLSSKINQLEAQLAVTGIEQVKPAKPRAAEMLAPKPKKSAIFGFVVGLVLAAVAAFALSRFDRRLRSLADIERAFQVQILSALPKVRRPILRRDGQPRPSRFLLEPVRRLHGSLQLGESVDGAPARSPRSVLFVSADAGDGKSTLVASLGLVQRDAGERVTVIEANFRRPALAKLLGIDGPQGLAEVLTGTVAAADAMQGVNGMLPPAGRGPEHSAAGVATVVESGGPGRLSVLVGGGTVANPPALLASPSALQLLRSSALEFDSVLIDAPPPLEVSDVLPLLGAVDAIVIVARVGHTRATSAQRLLQLLARSSSAPVLGVVANAVSRADIAKYGLSTGQSASRWPGALIGR